MRKEEGSGMKKDLCHPWEGALAGWSPQLGSDWEERPDQGEESDVNRPFTG